MSWRLSPEPGPPPTTLAPNPFTPSPTFELFVDDVFHDDTEDTPPNTHTAAPTDRRRSRALSQVEVEGLKDLLGELDDNTSITDGEQDDSVDIPVQEL